MLTNGWREGLLFKLRVGAARSGSHHLLSSETARQLAAHAGLDNLSISNKVAKGLRQAFAVTLGDIDTVLGQSEFAHEHLHLRVQRYRQHRHIQQVREHDTMKSAGG